MSIDARDFGRLEQKADDIISILKGHCDDDRRWHEQIDARLRQLEESRARQAGKQSVISVIVSTIVAAVVGWASRHFA